MRRAKIVSEQRIVIGDVVLDYNSMTVTGHGKTQELPQKEFLLLYKLLSYPGQIFTRIQLMDEIWGVDSDTGWETVTVHIGRLRKRFEGWDEFEIVSVRGLGYKAVKKYDRKNTCGIWHEMEQSCREAVQKRRENKEKRYFCL